MSDVMSRDDKGRHYGMQNDRKNRGKMGGFVTIMAPIVETGVLWCLYSALMVLLCAPIVPPCTPIMFPLWLP
jgi:hypothetical protein